MADPPSDEELRARVIEELAWDALIDDALIDAEVTDGVVTLIGITRSYAERLAAQEAAQFVDGVHDLVNTIEVRPQDGTAPDEDVAVMVEKVLEWNAFVPHRDVDASVSAGWVTLTGSTPSHAQRQEAERAISALAGVSGVTNAIRVAVAEVAPEQVRDAISDALHRRATHRSNHIDVSVDGRVVTLEGPVQTAMERQAVLAAVRHAPGIDMVCDDLYMEPSGATE